MEYFLIERISYNDDDGHNVSHVVSVETTEDLAKQAIEILTAEEEYFNYLCSYLYAKQNEWQDRHPLEFEKFDHSILLPKDSLPSGARLSPEEQEKRRQINVHNNALLEAWREKYNAAVSERDGRKRAYLQELAKVYTGVDDISKRLRKRIDGLLNRYYIDLYRSRDVHFEYRKVENIVDNEEEV